MSARVDAVEPPRAPDLAPQRERLLELDSDLRPRLRAAARVQHHAQDAVDAEPGVPEAGGWCPLPALDLTVPFSVRSRATLPIDFALVRHRPILI
jgi:hypothetical protein